MRNSARVKKAIRSKQEAFIDKFCQTANVTKAAKALKIGRRTVYLWLQNDKWFKKQMEEANVVALGVLEDEATRRAVEGTNKPVFYKGDMCGLVREYSDTLMIVLLKARAPEKYRERISNEVTGKDGKDLIPAPQRLSKDQIDKLIDKL